MGNAFTRFLVESYLELRKVTWPRPIDAWNMTLIVIAMSAFVAIVLGAADLGLAKALTWIVGLGAAGH
jgi:preprotein translocase SecE subunit